MPGYPSDVDWNALNSSVGGQLIRYTPMEKVCYEGTFNAAVCSAMVEGGSTYRYPEDPARVYTPYWTGYACPLPSGPNAKAPLAASDCQQGNYPDYVIAAKNEDDIVAGVKFAEKHNVRLIVKNTGHEFIGKNLGFGSLSIWTKALVGSKWTGNWTPSSNVTLVREQAGKQAAITFGPGFTGSAVTAEVEKHNQIIVGGADPSVGIGGGWFMGGGHGPYSNQYGLGADNVLELEVVTPTGEKVVANENSYPDLFWALRGGGPSTFGIVTKVTMKTYPKPIMNGALIMISPQPGSTDSYYDAVAYLLSQMNNFTDFGLSGYPYLNSKSYTAFLMAPGKTLEQVGAFLAPLSARLKSYPNVTVVTSPYPVMRNFKRTDTPFAAYNISMPLARGNTASFTMGSRLLSRSKLGEKAIPALKKMLLGTIGASDNAYILPYPNAGGQVAKNRVIDNGVNPAWRDASMHFIIDENVDYEGIPASYGRVMEKYLPLLEGLSQDGAAYINEGSRFEKDWKRTYYGGGKHYERLLEVKRKYDPRNTMWCFPCVGADVFEEGVDMKLYVK
ncbi:FAD-binding domain-containing protein [Aulographum hederae CBS 113979]|uniref:FAD-binding domain-containing protein n=1 Tax=Aulographum hederae CBS 113979 TaxID=1176131 RepID=A0A6G1GSI2_9PEZI|nr:FAD-binding domain-containing protein [Aulographum hederae CBS 113979]